MTPLESLYALANLVDTHAVAVPDGSSDNSWQAVAFLLGQQKLIVSMAQVSEVLTCPPITRLPSVQSWVAGIANLRGNVLPIIDLGQFLTGVTSRPAPGAQVIAVEHKGARFGLVVNRMIGMRQVSSDAQRPTNETLSFPAQFQDCINGAAFLDDSNWLIFDAEKLIAHQSFQQVAI